MIILTKPLSNEMKIMYSNFCAQSNLDQPQTPTPSLLVQSWHDSSASPNRMLSEYYSLWCGFFLSSNPYSQGDNEQRHPVLSSTSATANTCNWFERVLSVQRVHWSRLAIGILSLSVQFERKTVQINNEIPDKNQTIRLTGIHLVRMSNILRTTVSLLFIV